MTGKQSAAMDKAEKAVKGGTLTPSQAAKKYDISLQGIYKRPWYKSWRAEQKVKEQSHD